MWRRYVFLAAFGLCLGVVALTLWLAPRVIDISSSGANVPPSGPLVIQFSVPIDGESAANHFLIEPAIAGNLRVVGASLIFEPESPLPYGLPLTVTLGGGLLGQNSLPLLKDVPVSFRVRDPRMVFMRELEGRSNLWIRENDGAVRQLSDEPFGIWDFNVSPDGKGIVVSSVDEDGSDDLLMFDPDGVGVVLLDCMGYRCRDGRWQPGGTLLSYERTRLNDDPSEPEVWLLDTADGRTWPAYEVTLFDEADFASRASRSPRWSADGHYLAYYKPDAGMIVILSMTGDAPVVIPANVELMGEWSPSGETLAYTELALGIAEPHPHAGEDGSVISHTEPALSAHAMVIDFESGQVNDLSEGLETDDGRPAWHPAIEAVAIGRSTTGGGRQVWIIYLSDDEAVALTDDPFHHHTGLSWSPDGKFLALMRAGLDSSVEEPSVWLLDLESGKMELAAEGAYLPGWLP